MYNVYYVHITYTKFHHHGYFLIFSSHFGGELLTLIDQEVSMSSKVVASKGDAGNPAEQTIEQLHTENAELYAAHEARSQENILLNEVISAGYSPGFALRVRHTVPRFLYEAAQL